MNISLGLVTQQLTLCFCFEIDLVMEVVDSLLKGKKVEIIERKKGGNN